MSADTAVAIDVLEQRIARLERALVGTDERTQNGAQQLVRDIETIEKTLSARLKDRKTHQNLLTKVADINKYTDPVYAARVQMSSDAKVAAIVAAEKQITTTIEQLQLVDTAKSTLDSQQIRASTQHIPKLSTLASAQLDLADKIAEHTQNVSSVVSAHNDFVMTVNKQLVYWDNIMKVAEKQKSKV